MLERHSLLLAHPDDDLVFMSPTLIHVLRAGHAVQSIYLTAGDAGLGEKYWMPREAGIAAAYTEACGVRDFTVRTHGKIATRASADGRVHLHFLRLPDGMLDAKGSAQSGHTSLTQLWTGACAQLYALDGSACYTRSQLLAQLEELLKKHTPQVLHMLNPGPLAAREHPDHQAAGLFAQAAAQGLDSPPALRAYVGSNSPQRPANVDLSDLHDKQRVFATYARFDDAIDVDDNIYIPMLAREYLAGP